MNNMNNMNNDIMREKIEFLESNSNILYNNLHKSINRIIIINLIRNLLLSDKELSSMEEFNMLSEYIKIKSSKKNEYPTVSALFIIYKLVIYDETNKEKYRKYLKFCQKDKIDGVLNIGENGKCITANINPSFKRK